MCGRQRCTLGPDSVFRAARVHTRRWNDQQSYRPSYNVAPGSYTPVVRMVNGGEGGGGSGTGGGKERAVQSMKWGLVPSFTKKSEKPDHYRMFNARSESVLEKASFRRLIPRNRCLALAEGFFEWKKDGSKRQPYYIHLANGEPFVFAALYDRWEDEQGNSMYSYTILTTRVCKRLEWLHDRMPVLLRDEEAARAWLEGDLSAEDIGRLSQPYEQPDLVWHAVTPAMGKPSFDGPECVAELKTKEVKTSAIANLFKKRKQETGEEAAGCLPESPLTGPNKEALESDVEDVERGDAGTTQVKSQEVGDDSIKEDLCEMDGEMKESMLESRKAGGTTNIIKEEAGEEFGRVSFIKEEEDGSVPFVKEEKGEQDGREEDRLGDYPCTGEDPLNGSSAGGSESGVQGQGGEGVKLEPDERGEGGMEQEKPGSPSLQGAVKQEKVKEEVPESGFCSKEIRTSVAQNGTEIGKKRQWADGGTADMERKQVRRGGGPAGGGGKGRTPLKGKAGDTEKQQTLLSFFQKK